MALFNLCKREYYFLPKEEYYTIDADSLEEACDLIKEGWSFPDDVQWIEDEEEEFTPREFVILDEDKKIVDSSHNKVFK